jgi:hypothetical protein
MINKQTRIHAQVIIEATVHETAVAERKVVHDVGRIFSWKIEVVIYMYRLSRGIVKSVQPILGRVHGES